jgi:hypothetical protein
MFVFQYAPELAQGFPGVVSFVYKAVYSDKNSVTLFFRRAHREQYLIWGRWKYYFAPTESILSYFQDF